MTFQRPPSDRFLVERLPDGSAVVFDRSSEAVHSLNRTAALVWDCCAEAATFDEIAGVLARAGAAEPRSAAEAALAQLTGVGLVESHAAAGAPLSSASRRAALRLLGASAIFVAPLVVTMTLAEQHAFAQGTGSPGPTPTPTAGPATASPTPTSTPTSTPTPTPTSTPTPTTNPTGTPTL